MNARWTALVPFVIACSVAHGQDTDEAVERWRFEGDFEGLTAPVAVSSGCGDWNAFSSAVGYLRLAGNAAILEGLGCTLPLGDGSDTTLHPCTKSDQLDAWANSDDASLLPTLSFQAVQLNRETGAFFLAGEAIHGDEKVCFQTTGTAARVE